MILLTHTTDSTKGFGISFSLLNFVNDYSSLMEYLFKKDIANTYIEIGKKFHANMSGEFVKLNLDYLDYKDENSIVYLSPHSVSNTYLMTYLLKNNARYNDLIFGSIFMEMRTKAYLVYNGYKFILRSIFDILNIDKGNIIELKTASFYKYTVVEERNYDMQAYIYSIMSHGLYEIENIYFVFVTTVYPFKEIIRKVSVKEIENGKTKFYHKLNLLIQIIENNNLHKLFFSN